MSNKHFRALLDWFMCSDPWPADQKNHELVTEFIEDESTKRGYGCWVEAYHDLKA